MTAIGRLIVDVSFAVMVAGTSLAVIMIVYHLIKYIKENKNGCG